MGALRALLVFCFFGLAAGISRGDANILKPKKQQHKKKQYQEPGSSSSGAMPQKARKDVVLPKYEEDLGLTGDAPGETVSLRTTNCEGHIEELESIDGGAAYAGKIFVGYKEFKCLPDTGSFDLEIISQDCKTMKGTGYQRNMSLAYKKFPIVENAVEDLMFGSGPCKVLKGSDHVALSNGKGGAHDSCKAPTCPIGEILETSIKELIADNHERDFDAICGYGMGPKDKSKHRLISQLGVNRVGFCFRKDVTKGGIAHWNYKVKQQMARGFRFSTVNAVGPYWGMAVRSARLSFSDVNDGKPTVFACGREPCLAVIDTGTTLHSMDSNALDRFRKLVGDREDLDCDAGLFEKLPTMCYSDENNNQMCLHPHDYVFEMDDADSFLQLPNYIRESLAFSPQNFPNLLQRKSGGKQCLLALADSGEQNMHVFGMQWFRTHWFGFDTKSSAISWAKHDGNCNPHQKNSKNFHLVENKEGASTRAEEGVTRLRVFDPKKIRPSGVVQRMKHAKRQGSSHYRQLLRDIGMHEVRSVKFKQDAGDIV